jgi:hypothetical protein
MVGVLCAAGGERLRLETTGEAACHFGDSLIGRTFASDALLAYAAVAKFDHATGRRQARCIIATRPERYAKLAGRTKFPDTLTFSGSPAKLGQLAERWGEGAREVMPEPLHRRPLAAMAPPSGGSRPEAGAAMSSAAVPTAVGQRPALQYARACARICTFPLHAPGRYTRLDARRHAGKMPP